jgi:hypothetical protein
LKNSYENYIFFDKFYDSKDLKEKLRILIDNKLFLNSLIILNRICEIIIIFFFWSLFSLIINIETELILKYIIKILSSLFFF